jgi:hypothetical protein
MAVAMSKTTTVWHGHVAQLRAMDVHLTMDRHQVDATGLMKWKVTVHGIGRHRLIQTVACRPGSFTLTMVTFRPSAQAVM